MKALKLHSVKEPAPFFGRTVSYKDYDYDKVIKEDCFIELEGNMPMYYIKLSNLHSALRYSLNNLKFHETIRSNGIKSHASVLIGNKPANPSKEDFCHKATIQLQHGREHEVLMQTAQLLSDEFQAWMPRYNELAKGLLSLPRHKILPNYMIGETVFTSGIVNKNNPIAYHYDTANMSGCLSCLLVVRGNMAGGLLVLPEYRAAIACQDEYLLIFNGRKILHGVSELIPLAGAINPYRYSIVFYTIENMTKCLANQAEALERQQNSLDKHYTKSK
jgi:hypothetical protein